MESLWQDIRSAVVGMRRAPGFAATAFVTLALGVGATTAVFSIVYGVLLRPLPYADPDRLVRVWEEYPGGRSPAGNRWLSRSTYAVWKDRSQTLDVLGGYAIRDYQVTFGGQGVKATGAQISPAVMAALGVAPALGRLLADADAGDGTPPAVVLSDRLWRERFGASPDAVGATLVVDGISRTVVGVSSMGFGFPDPGVRFWIPHAIPELSAPSGPIVFTSVARLKPGATPAQAEAEGTAAARSAPKHRLTELFFGKGGAVVVHVKPLGEDIAAPARPALSVLGVAVALVLLIACANVTNLLLSRGVARQRELAIRAAIGGSRARIVRQLFTESAVLALTGAALGLGLAWWLVRLLPALAPATMPRLDSVALDQSVLGFWILTAVLAAVLAGLLPAVRGARVGAADALRSADRFAESGFRGIQARRLRDGLLLVEAAFAVVLIVGASLLAHSFVRLMAVDSGYTADGVLVASVELPRGATDARADQFIDAVLARLRALPGVRAAGASEMIPLGKGTAVEPFTLPDSVTGGKPARGRALVYFVTPGYGEALGLRLRDGRLFSDADVKAGNLATLVNEEFVRQHLASHDVTGLQIPGLAGQDASVIAEVVGVVGNVLKDGNDRDPQPELYFVHGSHGQRIGDVVKLVIRTAGGPASWAQDVRGAVAQADPDAVIDRIEPLATSVAASLDTPRFAATVMSAFAAVAIALAAIGLYGALSYTVSQRARELAIRCALGARRTDIVRLVLREGLSVTFAGVTIGVLASALVTRLMRDLLFGVSPLDGLAFAVAPAVPSSPRQWPRVSVRRSGPPRPTRRRPSAARSEAVDDCIFIRTTEGATLLAAWLPTFAISSETCDARPRVPRPPS